MKNDTAYVQKLHVLSKSFMHQAFLLKMCIFCLGKNIFYLNNSFIQQAFWAKICIFMYEVHILCKRIMKQFYYQKYAVFESKVIILNKSFIQKTHSAKFVFKEHILSKNFR